ncbi:MAG: hypothetical protein Q9N34_08175 [Aquificota bacterium]|nr:hypothetical protein [Aquificota bacterium]
MPKRLIRKLCPDCKVPHDIPKEALLRMGLIDSMDEDLVIYKASEKGCATCNNTGYKGQDRGPRDHGDRRRSPGS